MNDSQSENFIYLIQAKEAQIFYFPELKTKKQEKDKNTKEKLL